MSQVFNFSAGPAMLPKEVLQQAQQDLRDWRGLGTSVMEISHRSEAFMQVAEEASADLCDLLNVPDNYHVLFCHGGARGQFAAVPLNLLGLNQHADYVDSGYWSHLAIIEAQKYCTPNVIKVVEQQNGLLGVTPMKEWSLSDNAAYVHFCPNETIEGIAIDESPAFGNRVVVADLSSTILSRPLDVSRYGVIYAGAQKNIGPSGITVVIVRDDLLGKVRHEIPSIFDYKLQVESDSMVNTPPTFAWYLSGLVFKWLKSIGGLEVIALRNRAKAEHLYQFIDHSDFYHNNVSANCRSWMNVPFKLVDPSLDTLFLEQSHAAGLHALKGHKVAGGMRASIYNAMPLEGVQALTCFMADFERRYG